MTITLAFFLVLFILILLMIYLVQDDFVDEETIVTTTTTTTTTQGAVYQQTLARQFEPNGQPFVIDPVDGLKIYVNTTDDLYEDANGFIWNLN